MDRKILHCDMNSFYASVELLDHPELRDVPVAVAGDRESRHGIILAKNQAAKAYGITTAETIGSAMRKCPSLTLLPPHHKKYSYYSRKMNEMYLGYTDLVEPFSVDESWLDITGSERLFGSAVRIADEIRERTKAQFGLTLSVGVSFNKTFAKMGSEYRKPDATTEITRSNYKELIWPQPVGNFFFVGGQTAAKLQKLGIRTIGELAAADRGMMTRVFGIHGARLLDRANGIDDDPVRAFTDQEEIKSIGRGLTFRRNICGPEDLGAATAELCDTVSARLRKHGLRARGVKVEITTPDFRRISRQCRLDRAVSAAPAIREAALRLVKTAGYMNKPIRLLTITAIDLTENGSPEQISIFDVLDDDRTVSDGSRDDALGEAMDEIRKKFGRSSIRYASVIGNDMGINDDLSIEDGGSTDDDERRR